MIKIFKNSFLITKNNLILIQPLILFLLITSFSVLPLQKLQQNAYGFYLVLLNILLLCSAFVAGWFGMIKKAVLNYRYKEMGVEYETNKDISLLKSFFPSVGQYFFPTCALGLLLSLITFVFIQVMAKVGLFLFSDISLLVKTLEISAKSVGEQVTFLNSLTTEQVMLLNKWLVFFMVTHFLFYLFLVFSPTIMFFKSKNPFIVLGQSISCVFKRPIVVISICIYLSFLGFIISGINALNLNLVFSLIRLFITLISIIYFVVVVFLSYEELFDSNNRTNG
ncbi:hypothetical protein J6Q66_05815 [bacterium]|nr:hypothetical protein [bacterium]